MISNSLRHDPKKPLHDCTDRLVKTTCYMKLLIRKFHLSKVSSNSLDDDANGERLVYTLFYVRIIKKQNKIPVTRARGGYFGVGGGGGGAAKSIG